MWFRKNPVDLAKYLPKFLQKDINFSAVTQAESQEHDKLRLAIQDIFAQFFIETATWGLASYEKTLALTPKPNDDYTIRRLRILERYQANQTSTVEFMRELVKRYAAENTEAEIIELNSDYSFKIKVQGGSIIYLEDLVEAVNLYKPAHLGWLLRYERPVDNKYYLGLTLRTSRKIFIKPAITFTANYISGQAVYGGFIRTAKYTKIKAGV